MGAVHVENVPVAQDFYIPGYNGNPDVGVLTPESTKNGYATYSGGDLSNAGETTITQRILPSGLQVSGSTQLTLTDCWLQDRLRIDTGATVVASDCIIESDHPLAAVIMEDDQSLLTLEDSTITRHPNGPTNSSRGIVVQGKSNSERSVIRRVQITSDVAGTAAYEDGLQPWGNADIIMLQIKAPNPGVNGVLYGIAGDTHPDGIQMAASNVTVAYCYLDGLEQDGTYAATSALSLLADFGNVDNVEVHHCYLENGNYNLDVDEKTNQISNFSFHDNIFGQGSQFGNVNWNGSTVTGLTWTNNVDHNDNPVASPQ